MNFLLKYLYKKRSQYYSNLVIGFIGKGEKVLDIGAGSGFISEILGQKAKITLLDVKDYNQTKLPLKVYDGKKIPFKDKSFDTALLLTVFHYIPNQAEFLKEVKRVCNKIIIVDDIYTTLFGKLLVNLNDAIVSNTVGIFKRFYFLMDEEFKGMFKKAGVKLIDSKDTRSFLQITRQKIYVLRA